MIFPAPMPLPRDTLQSKLPVISNLMGASEITANIYCKLRRLYWEGCVICSYIFAVTYETLCTYLSSHQIKRWHQSTVICPSLLGRSWSSRKGRISATMDTSIAPALAPNSSMISTRRDVNRARNSIISKSHRISITKQPIRKAVCISIWNTAGIKKEALIKITRRSSRPITVLNTHA